MNQAGQIRKYNQTDDVHDRLLDSLFSFEVAGCVSPLH